MPVSSFPYRQITSQSPCLPVGILAVDCRLASVWTVDWERGNELPTVLDHKVCRRRKSGGAGRRQEPFQMHSQLEFPWRLSRIFLKGSGTAKKLEAQLFLLRVPAPFCLKNQIILQGWASGCQLKLQVELLTRADVWNPQIGQDWSASKGIHAAAEPGWGMLIAVEKSRANRTSLRVQLCKADSCRYCIWGDCLPSQ